MVSTGEEPDFFQLAVFRFITKPVNIVSCASLVARAHGKGFHYYGRACVIVPAIQNQVAHVLTITQNLGQVMVTVFEFNCLWVRPRARDGESLSRDILFLFTGLNRC